MARSRYIYIIHFKDDIHGVFTVKKEVRDYWHNHYADHPGSANYVLRRYKNGINTALGPIVPWVDYKPKAKA